VTPRDVKKPPGLQNQHVIARRQGVDERGLARAGPGRREYDNGTGGLKDRTDAFQDFAGQLREFRTPVVDDRLVHRPQHPIRNVGRAWNL